MSKYGVPLIALAGYAGAGKSTAGKTLQSLGYKRFAFADPIKEILSRVYHVDLIYFQDPVLKETPHPSLNNKTPREVMQLIGTEGFRNMIDPNTWVNCVRYDIQEHLDKNPKCPGVYIDDLRFLTEHAYVLEVGSMVIYIDNKFVSKKFSHQSEDELANIKLHPTTAIVSNNFDKSNPDTEVSEILRAKMLTAARGYNPSIEVID